jgi:putative permease
MIYHQISILVSKIPAYRDYIQDEITPFLTRKLHSLEPNVANKISDSIQNFINSSLSFVSIILNNLWHSALTTINTVAFTLLVPIILFYLLRDWPGIKSHLYDLLPLKHRDYIVRIIKDISSILSAYIGGQLNICLILAIIYSIGLSLIGIDLSLLVGFLSGFFIIIPFVGILLAFSIAIILGYLTFGFTINLTYILALYATCFLLEGYFLTPKIIGDKIGLHPIWIMFSVFASGAVFGFIGIFFAIPIAGIIKVLLGYAIEWYKSSSFYTS